MSETDRKADPEETADEANAAPHVYAAASRPHGAWPSRQRDARDALSAECGACSEFSIRTREPVRYVFSGTLFVMTPATRHPAFRTTVRLRLDVHFRERETWRIGPCRNGM